MEKYYGFRVDIDSELDPVHIESMKDIAEKIISSYDFNEDEYFVYFHQLSIRPKEEHFHMDGGLSKRLKRIELSFSVNLKQRRLRRIKLFNFLLDKAPEKQIKWTGGADEVTFYLEGSYLADNLGFRNEIVTFISKEVRPDHRKIKVSLKAFPTTEFIEHFKSQPDFHLTQLDFRFQRPIILRAPKKTSKPIENKKLPQNEHESGVTIMGDQYIISGQAAAVGKKAKAENTTNQQILISNENIDELKQQLELLRSKIRDGARTTEDDLAVLEVGKAIEAAEKGNNAGILSHLKTAGSKALEIGEKIGIPLVTALLKQELGI